MARTKRAGLVPQAFQAMTPVSLRWTRGANHRGMVSAWAARLSEVPPPMCPDHTVATKHCVPHVPRIHAPSQRAKQRVSMGGPRRRVCLLLASGRRHSHRHRLAFPAASLLSRIRAADPMVAGFPVLQLRKSTRLPAEPGRSHRATPGAMITSVSIQVSSAITGVLEERRVPSLSRSEWLSTALLARAPTGIIRLVTRSERPPFQAYETDQRRPRIGHEHCVGFIVANSLRS